MNPFETTEVIQILITEYTLGFVKFQKFLQSGQHLNP